jgi:hypothetical protein
LKEENIIYENVLSIQIMNSIVLNLRMSGEGKERKEHTGKKVVGGDEEKWRRRRRKEDGM